MTIGGRIDIYFPDGRSETLWLDEGALTIGGGRDNSFRARHAGLGRRQLRFFRDGGGACVINLDASRDVTIDGAPAPVAIPQRLRAISHIRAGDLRIVFNLSGDEATVAMDAHDDATQPSAVRFRARFECAEITAWAFSSASATVSVENLAAEAGQFRVETSGRAAAWTRPERLAFALDGHDSAEIALHIKPPARSDIAPGDYPLRVTVSRLDGLEGALELVVMVKIGAYAGLSAALEPPELRPGAPFTLRLFNRGNQALPLLLRPHDPEQGLRLQLERDELRLGAGESAVVSGIAEARRRPKFGSARELAFALVVQARPPGDYLLSLPAKLTVKAAIQTRALAGLALAALGVVLALAALLYQPPQPRIASFQLSERQVAQGTPVELRWEAANAERFVIEADRAPVAELPGAASSFSLDTSAYVDPIEIALIGLTGEASDMATLPLEVYEPAIVSRFEADKPSLPRGIESELRLSWRVTGVATLDIALPAGFEVISEATDGGVGEMVIRGQAARDFEIALTAVDEIGNATRRALAIAVEAAECSPIDDVLLYTGPDPRFRRSSYARRSVPVLARGISADKEWLQVELANGAIGWGARETFLCRGFDSASLHIIVDAPSPPSPPSGALRGLAPFDAAPATPGLTPAGDNS